MTLSNQVYRSVLLNNGPRVRPQPDSSSPSLGSGEAGQMDTTSAEPRPQPTTELDRLLYRDDVPVNSRGDIIQFYNKVFIDFVKDYALRFSPNDAEVIDVQLCGTCTASEHGAAAIQYCCLLSFLSRALPPPSHLSRSSERR